MAVGEQLQKKSKQWVLDLVVLIICPYRHWFVTYEKKFRGNVCMGNDVPCKFVSIGSAEIKMHDGVVRILTEVHHVLELKKNLVFVGAMDLEGFSCCVEGGVMQIRGNKKFMVM